MPESPAASPLTDLDLSGEPAKSDARDSFAAYLAKRLAGDKGFRPGVPEEAAPLANQGDVALHRADLGVAIACIIDREADREKRFSLSQGEILEIGRACLRYAGTVNGAKMPVSITLYEVADEPPSEGDLARLRALQKSAGFAKVGIAWFYLDTKNKILWPGASSFGPFGRLGHRGWLTSVLQEPRRADSEIFTAVAGLPDRSALPFATAAILLLLLAVFVVEQLAKIGSTEGLLGVDASSLFALGGMNAGVTKTGEWYRLLSAALLHSDAFHLLLNGVALGLAGFVLETLLGSAWLVSLFFVGALGGSAMGLLVNPANIVSVGASGAVMGLLAAALVAATRLPPGAERTQIQGSMLQFLIPSLLPLATHRHGGRIDFAAHFGGALVGALSGYAILKIWPKADERPRFRAATKGFALVALACVAASLVLVKKNHAAYAAEASFAAKNLLTDDGNIPKDMATATKDVDVWGKDFPRDPRVRYFRAFRLIGEDEKDAAAAELKAGLSEREIFERAFGNQKLETSMRALLCALLLDQGKRDEAKREAAPVCKANDGSEPEEMRKLHLCD